MSGIGGYEQIIADEADLQISGIPVIVLSLAQLIVTKEAAGRLKDLAMLPVPKAPLEFKQKPDQPSDDPPPVS
jgi:hypothetical protein